MGVEEVGGSQEEVHGQTRGVVSHGLGWGRGWGGVLGSISLAPRLSQTLQPHLPANLCLCSMVCSNYPYTIGFNLIKFFPK